jgi:hypothetical protein
LLSKEPVYVESNAINPLQAVQQNLSAASLSCSKGTTADWIIGALSYYATTNLRGKICQNFVAISAFWNIILPSTTRGDDI